jgi:dipeptidyl aminopeptidase/acylaminoacyl peptidase
MWSVPNGYLLNAFRVSRQGLSSIAFSRDGTKLLTAGLDGIARLSCVSTGLQINIFAGHTAPIRHASFSPDGMFVTTASWDGTARVWSCDSGKLINQLSISNNSGGNAKSIRDRWGSLVTNGVTFADFSPDQRRFVTTLADGTASLWDSTSWTPIFYFKEHRELATSASFSPDGTRIVSTSFDGTARVWTADTGSPLIILEGHRGRIFSSRFSLDGSSIVTASSDRTARIWNNVPYRKRFPKIEATRKAIAEIKPLVRARLDKGESIESIRQWVATDRSLSEVDRQAYLIVTQGLLDEQAARRRESPPIEEEGAKFPGP